MNLQHLSDIHTGRHTQGIQHNVQRTAVGQEGHIFHRQYAGNNTLISVTSSHLISYRDLTLLSNVNADSLIHTGRKLIAVLSCKYLGIHNDTIFAVRHLQRSVADLSCLLAEDRTQQALFRCQLSLALRGHLAHQDISRANLRTNADDSPLIQILQSIIAHTGNILGDLLRSQLGVTGFRLIFLNMNRSIYIILYQTLT